MPSQMRVDFRSVTRLQLDSTLLVSIALLGYSRRTVALQSSQSPAPLARTLERQLASEARRLYLFQLLPSDLWLESTSYLLSFQHSPFVSTTSLAILILSTLALALPLILIPHTSYIDILAQHDRHEAETEASRRWWTRR